MDTAGLIGRAHAAKIGGNVGNYKVELFPIQNTFEASVRRLFPEIHANDRNSRYRCDFQKIDCDGAAGPPDTLGKHLRPAARCGTEIDDGIAGTREPVPLQELEQLIGRARSVPLHFRPVDIRISDVAFQPRAAGFASGHSLDFLDARIITHSAARIEGASARARPGRAGRWSRIELRSPRGNRSWSERPRADQGSRKRRRSFRARGDLRGDLPADWSASGSAHREDPRPVPGESRTFPRFGEGLAPQDTTRALVPSQLPRAKWKGDVLFHGSSKSVYFL